MLENHTTRKMSRQLSLKRNYSQSRVELAVQMIQAQQISLRKASKVYGIPRSTLSDKVNYKTPIKPSKRTILTEAEETRLVGWISEMSRIGFGRTKQELLTTVKNILDKDGRPNPFTDNRPGKDWYYAFVKRHPELSMRTTMQLAKERAIISPEKVNHWFNNFKKYMDEEVKDDSIFKDPTRWYNADESGFPMCPKSGKVLAPRGQSNVYSFSASDKTQITVLASMSAAGHYIKPMIVFPGQRFSYNPLDGFEDAAFGRSETGWMDSELFTTWLRDIFIPEVNIRGVKKPLVLFVDGHSTHLSLEVSTLCRENDIILYCLLEHASHLMQPCDLKLFSSLKEKWRQAVRDFQIEHIGETVTKPTFASVFTKAWEQSSNIEIAVNGFRDSGLFLFDVSQVLKTVKMEPSRIFSGTQSAQPTSTSEAIPGSAQVGKCLLPSSSASPLPSASTSPLPPASTSPLPPASTSPLPSTSTTALPSTTTAPLPSTSTEPLPSTSTITLPSTSTATLPSNQTESEQLCTSNDNKENESEISSNQKPSNTVLSPINTFTSYQSSNAVQPLRDQNSVSPAFEDVLKLPHIKQRKTTIKRQPLPKAISGDKFIQILMEKKQKKEDEEKAKQKRKQAREENRKKKEIEKLKKQQEKEEKRKQREQKKKEEDHQKEKSKERRKSKRPKIEIDTDSDSDSLNTSIGSDTDETESHIINREKCFKCDGPDDDVPSNWIGCSKCPRWLHRACVTSIDLLSLSESEIEEM